MQPRKTTLRQWWKLQWHYSKVDLWNRWYGWNLVGWTRPVARIINAPLKRGSGPAEFRRGMRCIRHGDERNPQVWQLLRSWIHTSYIIVDDLGRYSSDIYGWVVFFVLFQWPLLTLHRGFWWKKLPLPQASCSSPAAGGNQEMDPNISRTIDQDPSNCHTKAFSRNWLYSTSKKTPTADKHKQQLSQKKNQKKSPWFSEKVWKFFFLKLWSLQEFDPDFIFISAGFDGHEAWGGWGLVDGTRWGSESRSALDKNLRLDGGFKGFIFLPPLGGTNPIWRIFLKWVVQPPPRRLLDKMEFLGLLEIPTLLYPWRKKPCLHLHLFFQPNFTIKIGCLDPILPTKTSGWFDWLLQFEWGGVPGCIGVRDQRCHTSTWILSLKTDTW